MGISRFRYLFVQNHFVKFEYLEAKILGINRFQYNQVKAAVSGLARKKLLRNNLAKFELLFQMEGIFRKSKIYCLLSINEEVVDMIRLQKEIDQKEWYSAHKCIRFISFDVAIEKYFIRFGTGGI